MHSLVPSAAPLSLVHRAYCRLCALDVFAEKSACRVIADSNPTRVGNDAAGSRKLAVWIGTAVGVVYEAIGRYHRDFEEALVEAGLPLAWASHDSLGETSRTVLMPLSFTIGARDAGPSQAAE